MSSVTPELAKTFAPELHLPAMGLRPWRDDADYEKMVRVLYADKHSQGVEAPTSASAWRAELETVPHLHLPTDSFLVEQQGEVIAFQILRAFPEVGGSYGYVHHGSVLPEWKGRGIGGTLMRHGEEVLRERATAHPADAPKFFQVTLQSVETGARHLLEQMGYQPGRYFYEMVRPNLDDLPAFELPAGIETRPAQPAEYHKIWDTLVEAFKEHWGEENHGEEDYALWLKRPRLRPDLWQVAWDGDKPVAVVLNEHDAEGDARYNRKRGFSEDICTLKEYRGRGIAQALIVQGLRQFQAMGLTEAELSVDTENASGALRLYEKLGYHPTKTFIAYRKPL